MSADVKVLEKTPVSLGQTAPPQSQASVGTANKEIGHVSEFIKPAGAELVPNIPPEVSEHVKITSDRPDLTQVVDIEHAGPHVPVPVSSSGAVQLPMSKEEIKEFKTGDVEDSKTGLAILLDKLLKMFGI